MRNKLIKSTAIALSAIMLALPPTFVYAAESTEDAAQVKVTTIPKGNAYIPEGTVIEVEASKTFSSKELKAGDYVPLRVCENIIVNDVVVIPRNTKVKAVVTKARKSRAFGSGGKLEFSIVSVKALNGVEIPLEYSQTSKGRSDGGAVAVAALVSVVGGAFMKGKNVVINEGTKFEAVVSSDTDLETKLDDLAQTMDEGKTTGVKITVNK